MGSYPPEHPVGAAEPIRWTPDGEILPPAHGEPPRYQPQYAPPPPPPPARRRPGWAQAPATYLLVGINCAVFLAMVASGVSIGEPTLGQLMHWGADNAGAVLVQGQWWRIVTAMFVHVGILHIAMNMWCLWNLSLLAEPLMGSFGTFAVYILTGAAGNLLSTLVNWVVYHNPSGSQAFPVGAGASGAVFGIAGALIVLLKSKRLPVPLPELKRLRKSVIYFAVLNLVFGFGITAVTFTTGSGINIDNMAHMGGFGVGLLFALPMVPRIGSPRDQFARRLRIAVVLVTGLLVLFGFYIAQLAR